MQPRRSNRVTYAEDRWRLMMVTLALNVALAQPTVQVSPLSRVSDTLVEAKVLAYDLDQGLIAYRLVVRRSPADAEPPDASPRCTYAGMETYGDGAGVLLGLWDVAKVDHRATWWVYDPRTCITHDVSVARLREAKAAFAAARLDITSPPSLPTMALGESITTAGRTFAARATSDDDLALVQPDPNGPGGKVGYDLLVDGHGLYRRVALFRRDGAGGGSVQPQMVLVDGSTIVVGERHLGHSMGGISAGFSFSPALALP